MNITHYLKAGQPGLIMQTAEIERAISQTKVECKFKKLSWDLHRGIIDPIEGEAVADITDPIDLCNWLTDQNNTVVFGQNFNKFLEDIQVLQSVLNNLNSWKATGCCLVLVGPDIKVPPEVEPFFLQIEFDLPDIDELMGIMKDLGSPHDIEANRSAAEAARGLTEFEAETAFALSVIQAKSFDSDVIIEMKKQMIKKSGQLEFYQPEDESNLGGLHPLRKWNKNRLRAFQPGGEHLPKPKAVLLVGIPGTGKSLACKTVANILGWPLIRMDVGALKGSLVGQSEQNIRKATKTIDAFGSSVVWIDELEKAFAGVKSSGQTDGGSMAGMFEHFLNWMQERTEDAVIWATSNDISALPGEFIRRFDAVFFVDLPNTDERREIIEIMNRRYGSEIDPNQAKALKGWTGAEIEQLAKDSLFDGIDEAMDAIVPLSITMKEQIDSLQTWAKSRARRANDAEAVKTKKVRRIQK
jgi:hypothetical protein